ncbi:DUF4407 domain-containing protein [Actinocorallia aurantiaca]|uniref:DUF4407 domain-containing protein n=1 Tax=Actinocorallia aurantiaca TaxID=46204 RepID=A0ABN3TUA3_9ACTN
MTTTSPLATTPDLIPPSRPSAEWPAEPSSGAGRWLRARIGVDESVLDHTPTLRPYYTKIGALVLTISALAGASMLLALTKFLDAPWPLLIPPAAFWGWLIFSIDSWLITGMHGTAGSKRVFLVRLAMSVLLGAVIAEPLLLKVFEPAIHRQVMEDRQDERADKETALNACNPIPKVRLDEAALARCRAGGMLVSVGTDPVAISENITTLQARLVDKRSELEDDMDRLGTSQKLANSECKGVKTGETTGVDGYGPECRRKYKNAANLERTLKIGQRQQEISDLQDDLNELVAKKTTADAAYAGEVNKAIKDKLPDVNGRIGLLEELKGLESLAFGSLTVLIGSILLRLILILIDCLPVIAKRVGGLTAYDRNLVLVLETDEELHKVRDDLRRRRHLKPMHADLDEFDRHERTREQRRRDVAVLERVQQDDELNRRIDETARRKRGEV